MPLRSASHRGSPAGRARPRARCSSVVAALLVVVALPTLASAQPPRLLAVGDIHGATEPFLALLRAADLIDDDGRWSGGDAVLVQTGDVTDRGTGVREVIEHLMRLEREAARAGGAIHVLIGNHEAMNLMVNVRDVTPAIFGTFAGEGAAARRADAYMAYETHMTERSEALGRTPPDRMTRDAWMAAHPPGFVEYVDAFGPDGQIGRWYRSKPVALVTHETGFLHGGLHAGTDAATIDEVNARAREEFERFARFRDHLIDRGVILPFSTFQEILTAVAFELQAWTIRLAPGPPAPDQPPVTLSNDDREHLEVLFDLQTLSTWSIIDADGPLWFRGYALWPEAEGDAGIGAVCERYGVSRVVVGHTPTDARRITSRFGGRVFLIDTGMLARAYQGRPSALELDNGVWTAVYTDQRIPFAP